MRNENVKLIRADWEKYKTELAKFSVFHFAQHPLHALLPVPENEREEFYVKAVFTANPLHLILAFHKAELVGFCSGRILTFKAYQEVCHNMIDFFEPI